MLITRYFVACATRDEDGRPLIDGEGVEEFETADHAMEVANALAAGGRGAVFFSAAVNTATGLIEQSSEPTFIEPIEAPASAASQIAGVLIMAPLLAAYAALMAFMATVFVVLKPFHVVGRKLRRRV